MRTLLLTSCLFIICSPSHLLSHAIPTTTTTNPANPQPQQESEQRPTHHNKPADEKSLPNSKNKDSKNQPSVSSLRSKRDSSGYLVEEKIPREFLNSVPEFQAPQLSLVSPMVSPYSLEGGLEEPRLEDSYVISIPNSDESSSDEDNELIDDGSDDNDRFIDDGKIPMDVWLPELLGSDFDVSGDSGSLEEFDSDSDNFHADKRAREFIGKRAREFIGKRAREFIGKRAREFIGKRAREFIGKRAREFIGKRSREFIGKRPREFIGKRSNGSLDRIKYNLLKNLILPTLIESNGDEKRAREFIGKRAREFIGKRAREFIGKRAREFIGKRAREFIGKRAREFIGKRAREFIGKRAREFIGKRAREFIGKRPREFIGKRAREFIGKRPREFIGKRAREFIGKRSGQYVDKRPREFIGKRDNGDYKFDDDFLASQDQSEGLHSSEEDPFSFLRVDVENPHLDNLVFPSIETSSEEETMAKQFYPIDDESTYLQAVSPSQDFGRMVSKRPREFIGKRSVGGNGDSATDFVHGDSLNPAMEVK